MFRIITNLVVEISINSVITEGRDSGLLSGLKSINWKLTHNSYIVNCYQLLKFLTPNNVGTHSYRNEDLFESNAKIKNNWILISELYPLKSNVRS